MNLIITFVNHTAFVWMQQNVLLGSQVSPLIYRPSLNFIMETTRSSACMLWVVKTRLEWS